MSALVFDTSVPQAPLTKFSLDAKAVFVCPCSHKLFALDEYNELVQVEGDPVVRYAYEWKSRVFYAPKPMSFTAVQVIGDYNSVPALDDITAQYVANAAANQGIWDDGGYAGGWNDMEINAYELNGSALYGGIGTEAIYLIVDVYADGVLKQSHVVSNNDVLRLPAGFLSNKWEIGVRGNIPVRRLTLATSASEVAAR